MYTYGFMNVLRQIHEIADFNCQIHETGCRIREIGKFFTDFTELAEI